MAAKRSSTCPTDPLKEIDKLIARLKACQPTPQLDRALRHLLAARNLGGAPPRGLQGIAELRAEIGRLARWPNGPKMADARKRLKEKLLSIVRPLVEKGYGVPAKPLSPAFVKASGLSPEDAQVVLQSMLKSGCLIYPLGARGPMLHEEAC